MTTRTARRQRARDARNRALRTLAQGFTFSVLSALIVALLAAFTTATSWGEFGGIVVGWSFFQSVATAGLSWLMREYIDRDGGPLLPLDPPGEPTEG